MPVRWSVSCNGVLGGVPRPALVENFARPSVAVSPKWALGADLTLRVVDSFFMGATDDAVRHDDRLGTMLTDKGENAFSYG